MAGERRGGGARPTFLEIVFESRALADFFLLSPSLSFPTCWILLYSFTVGILNRGGRPCACVLRVRAHACV